MTRDQVRQLYAAAADWADAAYMHGAADDDDRLQAAIRTRAATSDAFYELLLTMVEQPTQARR